MKVTQTINAQSVLHKIVVNTGIGRMATSNAHFEEKVLPEIIAEFKAVTGQQPSLRHAVKSIAGFKLRQGTVVGPLMTEIIGFKELTPYAGGWAGNEIAAKAFSREARKEAREKVRQLPPVPAP